MVQEVEPALDAALPTGHATHALDSSAPTRVEKVPARQLVHEETPGPAEYVPAGQIAQLLDPRGAYVPAPQVTQVERPEDEPYVPVAHGVHDVAPIAEYFPVGHNAQVGELKVLYLPAGQSGQLSSAPVYEPAGQQFVPVEHLLMRMNRIPSETQRLSPCTLYKIVPFDPPRALQISESQSSLLKSACCRTTEKISIGPGIQ